MTRDSREDIAERRKPPLSAWPKEDNQLRLMFNGLRLGPPPAVGNFGMPRIRRFDQAGH